MLGFVPQPSKEILRKYDNVQMAGSRYFCESLFWASQPKQAAKT
ncbi:hypothetical protein [Bathymodiolus platifrons methanotrophic gill symbiont]|nr:hypothetical protein [Bathymodiolus platifrons methanotrophic gill symbiont]